MKETTKRLLAHFAARRRMLLDHLPRHAPGQAASIIARYRFDIARGIRAERTKRQTTNS